MQKDTHLVGGVLAGAVIASAGAETINKLPIINIIEADSLAQISTVNLGTAGILIIAALFGSLYPDVDHRGSYMGRRLVVTSFLLSILSKFAIKFKLKRMKAWFSHRGISHSILAWLIKMFGIAFILNKLEASYSNYYVIINLLQLINIGVTAGAISHIALDFFNPTGVPIFMPLTNKKFHMPIFNVVTGTMGEIFVRILLVCLIIYIFVPI